MANREELGLIRAARGGQAEAQLALGRVYLYGSAGLPKSLPTALHWLDRAAQQGCNIACELIGAHIPAELALQSSRPLAPWYERAWDLGVQRAGLVLAQLLLAAGTAPAQGSGAKARAALEGAAAAGAMDARALLARWEALAGAASQPVGIGAALAPAASPAAPPPALHERLWQAGNLPRYLECALPQARALVAGQHGGRAPASLERDAVRLLSRCARALAAGPLDAAAEAEMRQLRDIAADENDPECQLAVGLWHARMQVDGKRVAIGAGSANFKKAIRWLVQAGEQGLAEAWYALSRIYIKPEFSQRSVIDAQRYLERAADMGYRDAQLECGNNAWRARRENAANDVRAVYWLQQAAAQGCPQARAGLERIAPRAPGTAFAALAGQAPVCLGEQFPLLAARLRLATLFQLSRAEALLLDVVAADQGHCLVIDIRSSYGRSRRRLVSVATGGERRALDEIVQVFEGIDCSPCGPEGNYRQRLYRLKTVLPEAEAAEDRLADEGDEEERLDGGVLCPAPVAARQAARERVLAAA